MTIVYDAFISYSHAKDKPVAAALQSVMQRLGKPWYQRRALRIFRDDTSLAATPELWPTIEVALEQSRYIVLLASPQFAASKWCGMEVAYWLEHKSQDNLLIAVTEGDLFWDDATGDFRWTETTPLPASLKGRFRAEPKWIDLRDWRDAPDARAPRFIDAGADFAAAIRGMPKEDLLSQEVRQQRRALTLAWSAAATLLALVVLAGWQWRDAVEQRNRAELALQTATETSNTLVVDLANEFRDRAGMPVDLIRKILERARKLQTQLVERGETLPALLESASFALDEMVITLLDLGEMEAAVDIAKQSLAMSQRLATIDPNNDGWRRGISVSYNKIGWAYLRAGRREEAIAAYQEALAIIGTLVRKEPTNAMYLRDTAITLGRLSSALVQAGQREAALKATRASLEMSLALAEADPKDTRAQRDLTVSYDALGDILIVSQFAEAIEAYRKSLAIREKLAAADPGSIEAQRDLSAAYDRLGTAMLDVVKNEDALSYFQKSLDIRERLAAADSSNTSRQQDLVISYHKVGDVLARLMRNDQALAYVRKALAINEALVEKSPDNRQWQRELALSLNKVGDVLVLVPRRDEALPAYRRSLAIIEELLKHDAANVIWQEDAADTWDRIGVARSGGGDVRGSIDAYREALAIRRKMVEDDPKNGRRLRTFNVTANRLAAALTAQANYADALKVYTESLAIAERLSALDPENKQWRSDVAFTTEHIGDVLIALKRFGEAIKAVQRGLDIVQALVAAAPEAPHWQRLLSISYERMGRVFTAQQKLDAARDVFEKSRVIRVRLAEAAPQDPTAQLDLYIISWNLALTENQLAQPGKALAAFRDAFAAAERLLTLAPNDAEHRTRLGSAIGQMVAILSAMKQSSEAIVLLKRWLKEIEQALAADGNNLYWAKQRAITFAMLAGAGDAPRERYAQALAIVRRLEKQGSLEGEELKWVEKLEAAIAALPS